MSYLPQAYAAQCREDWVKEWPGQVVLCVTSIYWTLECHEYIRDGAKGLKVYWDKLQEQVGLEEFI